MKVGEKGRNNEGGESKLLEAWPRGSNPLSGEGKHALRCCGEKLWPSPRGPRDIDFQASGRRTSKRGTVRWVTKSGWSWVKKEELEAVGGLSQ